MNAILRTRTLESDAAAPGGARASRPGLLRFIACGSVDDGKSTLIGRLLYDSHCVPDDQIEALGRDSQRFGTQGDALDLALLVDGLSAEREQGITIDVAYRYFATGRRSFIVADAPGHEQYTRNMATGASTAELAIILIDARKGISPQTRRHSFIVSMLGVRHVAVAVNKMDLVGFDQATFERICAVYRTMAKELGFEEISFFPISARDGDNVASPSRNTPWRSGPTLLDHLETVEIGPRFASHADLLFPVQFVSRPDSTFRGYAGTIAQGVVRPGDDVAALPRGSRSKIVRIVSADGDLAEAVEGQSVCLTLSDEIDVSRGDVLASVRSKTQASRAFKARLLWTGDEAFSPDESYLFKLGPSSAQARVAIEHTIDVHSFAPLPAQTVRMNDIAVAEVALDRNLVSLPYAQSRELGGFVLIDRRSNGAVALGLVEPAERRGGMRARAALGLARGAERLLFGRRADVCALEEAATQFASFAVSTLLFLALARNLALAAGFALMDRLARQLARQGLRRVARARRGDEADESQNYGAGI